MSGLLLETTAGVDALIDVVLSYSVGTLAQSDIVGVRCELRKDPTSAAILTKTLGAGISYTSTTSAGVGYLVTIPASDTTTLGANTDYFMAIIGQTTAQKDVAASGYLRVNQPTIS